MTAQHGDRSLGSVAVVIAAAGRGTRLGGASPKALERICGSTLLDYCLDTVSELPGLGVVVVAAPPSHLDDVRAICSRVSGLPIAVVAGGASRPESVANALAELPDGVEVVLVHDAARAFTPVEQFLAVIDAVAAGAKAVVPGVAIVDTIKEVDDFGTVLRTVDRTTLRGVQTPQGFDRETLVAVHADVSLSAATDDAGMVEASGGAVQIIVGHQDAFKITTPFDRTVAEALVASRNGAN